MARILLAAILVSAILLFLPFLFTRPEHSHPLAWAPGYWQLLPEIGLARIVPLAPAILVSPATGAGTVSIRGPAQVRPAAKY